jgi:hypothetical protein
MSPSQSSRLLPPSRDPAAMAFSVVRRMAQTGISPRLRSYDPALLADREAKDADGASQVEAHMVASVVVPEEPELAALLRVNADNARADEVYRLLHRTRCRRQTKGISSLIDAVQSKQGNSMSSRSREKRLATTCSGTEQRGNARWFEPMVAGNFDVEERWGGAGDRGERDIEQIRPGAVEDEHRETSPEAAPPAHDQAGVCCGSSGGGRGPGGACRRAGR